MFWRSICCVHFAPVAFFHNLCWMDAINLSILHSREREVTKFLQRAVFCCYCPSSSLSPRLPVELPHWSPHIISGLTLKPLYQKPSLITLLKIKPNFTPQLKTVCAIHVNYLRVFCVYLWNVIVCLILFGLFNCRLRYSVVNPIHFLSKWSVIHFRLDFN